MIIKANKYLTITKKIVKTETYPNDTTFDRVDSVSCNSVSLASIEKDKDCHMTEVSEWNRSNEIHYGDVVFKLNDKQVADLLFKTLCSDFTDIDIIDFEEALPEVFV